MKQMVCALAAAAVMASFGFSAQAFSLGEVDIHGFASQGFLISSDNNYLASTDEGSFEFTEAALNASTQLTDSLRLGLQFFSRDLGDLGNNEVKLDWAFADYRHWDFLGVRAGKFKLPFGLYNEIRDYDMLRTSILLPQSVYDETWRETMVAVQGGELYGNVPAGPAGDLDYQLYVGTTNIGDGEGIAKLIEDRAFTELDEATVNHMVGGSLHWNTPLPGLMVGASGVRADLDIEGRIGEATRQQLEFLFANDPILSQLGLTVPDRIALDIDDIAIWVFSGRYTLGGLTLAGEYARQRGTVEVEGFPAILGNQDIRRDTEGWYVLGSYRFCDWFELGSYYSVYHPDREDKDGNNREAEGLPDFLAWQKDWALSLRFDINEWWLVKFEAHVIDGAGLVFLSDNKLEDLEENWQLYTIKTSVSF